MLPDGGGVYVFYRGAIFRLLAAKGHHNLAYQYRQGRKA